MQVQLINRTIVDVIKSSRAQVMKRRMMGGSQAPETTYKFYALVTGTEFDAEEADWLLLEKKKARIWKMRTQEFGPKEKPVSVRVRHG